MTTFFETRSYWQGGFTEDQQKYYKEYRLSQKGIHSWGLIQELYDYARNLCSTYNISFCRDESCCFMRHKHLAFQCEYNDDETLASYAKGNYDFYDAEQIEEVVIFKGAYEIASFVENIDDAPYKSESLEILNYCFEDFNEIIILLTISKGSLQKRNRLMFCRTLWKKKLLKLNAPWMKKRRRVTNKRRKNGVATHLYLLMRVTL